MEKFVETGVALFMILKGLLSLYDFQSKVAIRFRKIIYIEILPNRLVDIGSLRYPIAKLIFTINQYSFVRIVLFYYLP